MFVNACILWCYVIVHLYFNILYIPIFVKLMHYNIIILLS